MFDMTEFHTKGFLELSEPDGLDLIDIDSFKLLNREDRLRDNGRKDLDPDLVKRLDMFSHHLLAKYIQPEWPNGEFAYWIVWEGVDHDNTGWHTDFMEKYDVFFLYYFDDTTPENGGSISFKWGDETYTKYPKAGDLFLVSNEMGFWHKAEHTSIERRVASFNYHINDGT